MKIVYPAIWFAVGLLVGLAFGIVFVPRPVTVIPRKHGIVFTTNPSTVVTRKYGIVFRDGVYVYDVKRENAEDVVEDINKNNQGEQKP